MAETIRIGYEVPTGDPVETDLKHLIATGVTESGKTTCLESIIDQTDKKSLVFTTKNGEEEFTDGHKIRPYFKDEVDWEYVKEILETVMDKDMDFQESWIINAVDADKYDFLEPASTLEEVHKNIKTLLAKHRSDEDGVNLRGLTESVYTSLDKYFEKLIPRIKKADFATDFELKDGLNIVDLREFDKDIQSLVISRMVEKVYQDMEDTIVIMPEAWKFIPQNTSNPCERVVEQYIREGATNGNYLIIDSQDMTGVSKTPLKQVRVMLLGYQSEKNEVDRTRDQMPVSKRKGPSKADIMNLEVGHFYYCEAGEGVTKVYVPPVWIDQIEVDGKSGSALAHAVATGDIPVEAVKKAKEQGDVDTVELDGDTSESSDTSTDTSNDKEQGDSEEVEKMRNEYERLKEREQQLKDQLDTAETKIKKKDKIIERLNLTVNRLEEQVDDLEERVDSEHQKRREVNAAIDKIRDALSVDQPLSEKKVVELIENKVENEVPKILDDMDLESGSTTVYDNPQDAIMHEFQDEAIDDIMDEVKQLSTRQKKIVKYMEARGSGIDSMKQLCLNLFGYKNGDIYTDINGLVDKGFLRKDKGNNLYPNMKSKIESKLEAFDADEDGTVDQTYNEALHRINNEV